MLWLDRLINPARPRKYQAYAILTICRSLYSLKKGNQVSKKQAAKWAQKQFPEWKTLIAKALTWREDWKNESVDHKQTLPQTQKFVNFIIRKIKIT